ncbi:hypothetical protein EPN15_02300 [Patescibacteria group bacterium]|nr:MAG: hypothetical protein EPN15_02300 [Patescibacteria group bacterium]
MKETEEIKEKRTQQTRKEIRDYITRRFGKQPLILPLNGKTVMVVDPAVIDEEIKARAKKLNIGYSDKGVRYRLEADSPDDFVKLFYHFEY